MKGEILTEKKEKGGERAAAQGGRSFCGKFVRRGDCQRGRKDDRGAIAYASGKVRGGSRGGKQGSIGILLGGVTIPGRLRTVTGIGVMRCISRKKGGGGVGGGNRKCQLDT